MIVTCTACQARFRIPDERIGPKGAKVRCSKCKNVFVVKPSAAAGEARAPPNAFAAPPAAPDPFASAAVAGPAGPDPFAAAPPADPYAAADPFAAAPAGPSGPDAFPMAPPSGSRMGADHLPVTDLSDLAGGGGASPPPAGLTALAPPLPATPPAPAAGAPPETAAVSSADDLVLEEPSRAIPVVPPPIPAAPAFDFAGSLDLGEPGPAEGPGPDSAFEFGASGTDLSEPGPGEPVLGLALGASAGTVPGGTDFAGADPFAGAGAGEPFGGAGPLAEPGRPGVPTVTEPLAADKPPAPAPARPVLAARRKTGAAPEVGPLSAPASRGRFQAFVANAVSLAALLAAAAGLLSWWLRDTGREPAGGGPIAAVEVSSGLYEAGAGPPVLFVRGEVQSHGAVPLGRVAVRAEVVLGGEVRARAEGLAGAVPTAEEVAQIASPEDAARLRARVASRAPARLEPGGSLPFLVIFDAVPEGFRDAVFRVEAEPLPHTARAP